MTGFGAAGPATAPTQVVWWPDTSALVTLAIIPAMRTAVVTQLTSSPHTRAVLLARAVSAELEGLGRSTGQVGPHARAALGQLNWMTGTVLLDDPDGTQRALGIQREVAAGRPLERETDHWGEAAIIALAERAQSYRSQMLSDDYSARIAADNHKVASISVPKLLSRMVAAGTLSLSVAHGWLTTLHRHQRCPAFTAEQVRTGQLANFALP